MGAAAAEPSPELSSYQLEPVVAGDTPLYSHHYPCASLLVCRVVDWEELKFTLSSQEQLNWLHDLHVWVDDILQRVPAMKGDFSGDILQFISGTENEDPGHVNTLVTLAKELLDLEVKLKLPNGQPFQVQMGMHTGECMTGVVGSLALKYSIFGPAVTVAHQLEALSAPGLLRISADSKRHVTGSDSWINGGTFALPGWREVDTFLLGAAAERLSAPEARRRRSPGSGEMGRLLSFRDERMENAFLKMQDSELHFLNASVCTSMLLITLLAVASLAFQNRIVLPTFFGGPAGRQEEGVPLQLAVGTTLAWVAAVACLRLGPEASSSFREPVCMLLRIAFSVNRVQSIYLSLANYMRSGAALPPSAKTWDKPYPPETQAALVHAAPVLLLSLLLIVRLQKHVMASLACLVLETAQIAWTARSEGSDPVKFAQHAAIYAALTCILPTAFLYLLEARRRKRYLATVR